MSDNKIKGPLEKVIDFNKAVLAQSSYKVDFDGSVMQRLNDACQNVENISLDIKFYKDLQGLRTVEGDIQTKVTLICQRCNKPFVQDLQMHFKSTSDYEMAKSLRIEDKLDFIELDDGKFNLLDYLEDCLLLTIPIAPMHEENSEDCLLQGCDWSYGKIESAKEDNPFAILSELKGSLKK